MDLGEPLSRNKYGISGNIWKHMDDMPKRTELFIIIWDSLRSTLRISLALPLLGFLLG